MFDAFFELSRYILILVFGIVVSADFLDIKFNKKNIGILGIYFFVSILAQGTIYLKLDENIVTALYPIIVHVPLLLLFVCLYKKKIFPSMLAIMTAYLCCQIANWFSNLIVFIDESGWKEDAMYSVALIITALLVRKYVAKPFSGILAKQDKALLSFAIIPVFYYVFDYLSTVYTEQLYEGNVVAVEFPPLLLAVCYIVFCAVYFRQYEEAQEIETKNRLILIRQQQAQKDIETMHHNEKKLALMRHDMRHFLNNIYQYLENDEVENARKHIEKIVESIDKTTNKRYCQNETINYIISFYENTMESRDIDFSCKIVIPNELRINDVDMTSILSNGLENALRETSTLDKGNRKIELYMAEKSGKLLVSIENTYGRKPVIVDGNPISAQKGHGLGTQSIRYTAEKLNGNCHFSVTDDRFIMQVIL